ncbi:class II glutamine amidotransferase [Eubacterium sp. 1001713B170207_170306_E7]|uniref:class II glutamine amidotransferase n=1 Tax=Eubacterium sp. 1001713B170207_170306_E7 TaxID=2787097 RepID=UPI00189C2906|nr:class II glutamine amidotransferase [Eubacterium sp. 1001713B170207_170306_E7]
MCELYGMTGDTPVRANSMLKEFYAHSPRHPHGWGIRYFDKDGDASMCKEAVSAHSSLVLPQLLSHEIKASALIAHIRFATIGSIAEHNSHPFITRDNTGREWTLAHNGNIYSGMELLPYLDTQAGETDSERVLLYLTNAINEAASKASRPLDAVQRAALLEKKLAAIAKRNKLNLLIYDGETYYVHTNIIDTLYSSRGDGHICFSTHPLSKNGYHWQKVPLARLFAYKGSQLIYAGQSHGHIFKPAKLPEHDSGSFVI